MEISYAFREEKSNVYMMTEGVEAFKEFAQTFVYRKSPINPLFLDDYCYLDCRTNEAKRDLTETGEHVKKILWENDYSFVAIIDTQIEFSVNAASIAKIAKKFHPLWTSGFWVDFFDGSPTGFITFVRVYKTSERLDETFLVKGRRGSSQICKLYDELENEVSVQSEILEPVISDNKFEYIKEKIIHILKTENALISVFHNNEIGKEKLQKRIDAELLMAPKRDLYYYSDTIIDRSRLDYEEIFDQVIEKDQSLQFLIDRIRDIKPPQMGEMNTLLPKAKAGNKIAKDRLVEMYLKVVLRQAMWFSEKYRVPVEEAFQEGVVGLLTAIEKYDLKDLGNTDKKFSTYAPWWIRQNMGRNIQTGFSQLRLPVHVQQKIEPIVMYINSNYEESDFDCLIQSDYKELLRTMKCDIDELEALIGYARHMEDIDFYIENEDECLSDCGQMIEKIDNEIYNQQVKTVIHETLSEMKDRDRDVLFQRNGIGCAKKSLEEIASQYGLTRERIRQIEAKAMSGLKRNIALKQFYGEENISKEIYFDCSNDIVPNYPE